MPFAIWLHRRFLVHCSDFYSAGLFNSIGSVCNLLNVGYCLPCDIPMSLREIRLLDNHATQTTPYRILQGNG